MTFDLQALISDFSIQLPTSTWKVVPPFALLWAAYRINQYLSTRALNNGVQATFDWKKEIVLVTGGSDGIGAATVLKLAERGTLVIVLDIRPLQFDAPKNVHYYRCDLTNRSELTSVAETLRREVGIPTCVMANAGICRGKPLLHASPRDIELTFAVNNLALVWTAQTFLPAMVEQNHGHFLIMASQTAHLATAGVVDYAATKAAALAIYEGLQTELRHVYRAPAVRVSCVAPSAVQTKMFRGIQTPASVTLLNPADVGSLVAEILWSGKAQNRMTPALAYISPPTRALPDWMRVGFQDLGKDVMSTLSPHQPMDEI
ncbi:Short-chain dehydrogenase/reductase family 16C member 6 [Penicillium rolfsii]|nr:Short-chain dehydrogenase/reductase family 16C member 6 [Penicillium rolfsii]